MGWNHQLDKVLIKQTLISSACLDFRGIDFSRSWVVISTSSFMFHDFHGWEESPLCYANPSEYLQPNYPQVGKTIPSWMWWIFGLNQLTNLNWNPKIDGKTFFVQGRISLKKHSFTKNSGISLCMVYPEFLGHPQVIWPFSFSLPSQRWWEVGLVGWDFVSLWRFPLGDLPHLQTYILNLGWLSFKTRIISFVFKVGSKLLLYTNKLALGLID